MEVIGGDELDLVSTLAPMKRGLKEQHRVSHDGTAQVSTLAPMKRGLKAVLDPVG